jgi:hypothetical protein
MKHVTKAKVVHLPKVIILSLALLNLFYVISHISPTPISTDGKISFSEYTPWYETSDVVVVWIILAASVCLLISRRSSYLIAGVFSGYFTVVGFVHLFLRKMTLLERWRGIQKYEMNIFLVYEVQWILAGIVFSATIFYLIREYTRRNLS